MKQQELNLPKKLYYSLAEASQFLGVKPHVLRYWDKEFKVKQKRRSGKFSQKYHRQEVKKFFKIKGFLYDELFSIAGAKKKLAEKKRKKTVVKNGDYQGLILRVKRGLKSIEALLD